MVQEAVTAVAEGADDGQDRRRLCSVFYLNLILIRFIFFAGSRRVLATAVNNWSGKPFWVSF